jgi:SAP domain-containing ribonucleoprotein
MTDYSQLKVPDLKKLLSERGLAVSGNKADLISRLQEHDKKPAAAGGTYQYSFALKLNAHRSDGVVTAGEDEIDWDEDDNKATASAAAAVAAGGRGQVANPPAASNQKAAVKPATTTDSKVSEGVVARAPDGGAASSGAATAEAAPAPEAPKQDFSIGIQQTDAEKEAEKRAARAKRFGIPEDDEAKKLAERAKKFGLDAQETVVKGLDSALPERRAKRGREDRDGGRSAKRQTPDRRTEAAPKVAASTKAKKPAGRVLDDPVEKAKAEARAKRFQQAA